MKKIAIIVVAIVTLYILTATATAAVYPQTFLVVDVDYENDLIILETASGFQYEWSGVEDWFEGDLASAIMADNETPDITDDLIVDLRYAGYWY